MIDSVHVALPYLCRAASRDTMSVVATNALEIAGTRRRRFRWVEIRMLVGVGIKNGG